MFQRLSFLETEGEKKQTILILLVIFNCKSFVLIEFDIVFMYFDLGFTWAVMPKRRVVHCYVEV